MRIPPGYEPSFERPVGIFGWGVSGKAVFSVVRRLGCFAIVYDEHSGEHSRPVFDDEAAARHDLIVYSPGFAPGHPWLALARKAGCTVLSEVDFASLFWEGPIVAVTGTNGKTTLTNFLVGALRAQGVEAVAAGNIGYPFSRLLEMVRSVETVLVLELSSFQTETLEKLRPHAVIWTNFAEDHLDRHATEKAYFLAKYRLVAQLQRPRLLVGASVAGAAERLDVHLPSYARTVRPDSAQPPEGSALAMGPQRTNTSPWKHSKRPRGTSLRRATACAR